MNSDQGPIILLGLIDANVERLKDGKPMMLSMEELGFKGLRVMLMCGATEDSIKAELQKHFEIPDEAVIDHREGEGSDGPGSENAEVDAPGEDRTPRT